MIPQVHSPSSGRLLRSALAVSLALGATLAANAQWAADGVKKPAKEIPVKYGPLVEHRDDEAMKAFRNYGLGQFIHYGLYAIPGNEWEGQKYGGASEWIRIWSGKSAPKDWKQTYDNLALRFNPKDFDARRWAKQAKAMGVRYLIFTTKHHDGFALWPTKYSDYNIGKSPYKKDMVKEIVDAYNAEGIDVFLYFSILEWNNPDYMGKKPSTPEEKARFDRFLQYTRNQLFELLETNPTVKGLWFDGTWDASWVSSYEFTYQLEKDLRAKIPGLIIGSRFRNDEFGKRHFDSNGRILGDYEQGWERKLPATFERLEGRDWDCVMTIPPNGWGYIKNPGDMYLKNSDDVIDLLMRCRSMNGNFVLNFGPDGDGNMRPEENTIASTVGEWTKANAEAVYPARHSEFGPTNYGYFTQQGDSLYLTVINRPVNGVIRITVPKKAPKVPLTAEILSCGTKLTVKHADIGFDLDKNTYYDVIVPKSFTSEHAFVIKMKIGNPKSAAAELMDAKM